MKCNSKKVQEYKYNKEKERKEQERKQYIDTLTEEEKEQFFKAEKERQEKSMYMLKNLFSITSMLDTNKYHI